MQEILDDGTRIRFSDTLTCSATGEHPAFIFCRAGDGGRIEHHVEGSGGDRYSVYWDKWHKPFFCDRENFVIEGEPCRVPFKALTKGALFYHNCTVFRKVTETYSVPMCPTFCAVPLADAGGKLNAGERRQRFGDDVLVVLDIPEDLSQHLTD